MGSNTRSSDTGSDTTDDIIDFIRDERGANLI